MAIGAEGVALAPERDVEIAAGRAVATSRRPWLRVEDAGAFPPGAHVEIRYRSSIYDDPVRPVLRFQTPDGPIDRLLPGPVAGAGVWAGRVPRGASAVFISPTNQPGRFDFRLESVRRISPLRLYARGLRQSRGDAIGALACRLIGFEPEYDRNLGWATGFTPIEDYAAWKAARARPLEPDGLDAPRADWSTGPGFVVCVTPGGGRDAKLRALRAQTFPRWRLHEPDTPIDEAPAWVVQLAAGDELAPHALACLFEHAARHPDLRCIYADEETLDGGRLKPLFKPDWSPLLAGDGAYPGRMRATLARSGDELRALLAGASGAVEAAGHVRRVLMRCADAYPSTGPARVRVAPSAARIAIVIPSRDRVQLLRACVESVFRITRAGDFEIVIVDNGSVEPATAAYYAELAASGRRVRVIEAPGPFNFSLLCNKGAAAAPDADALVFLNNDTEALTPDWLDLLAERAMAPDIGAVGAKLFFPDGGVQHIDLVLGLQGAAGAPDRGVDAKWPGWLGRDLVAHEASAVTAACLAVSREKFDAIGGFDEAFVIELNDVDLCLRLAARGWRCVTEPAATLLHREGASRGGASLQRLSKHAGERQLFNDRWFDLARDDPFFHPGLSLERLRTSLG